MNYFSQNEEKKLRSSQKDKVHRFYYHQIAIRKIFQDIFWQKRNVSHKQICF